MELRIHCAVQNTLKSMQLENIYSIAKADLQERRERFSMHQFTPQLASTAAAEAIQSQDPRGSSRPSPRV